MSVRNVPGSSEGSSSGAAGAAEEEEEEDLPRGREVERWWSGEGIVLVFVEIEMLVFVEIEISSSWIELTARRQEGEAETGSWGNEEYRNIHPYSTSSPQMLAV